MKKLFIIYTHHGDYDETDPYIVIADTEEEARELVKTNESFIQDRDMRRRQSGELPWGDGSLHKWGDYRYGIRQVEEVPLTESKVVWAVENHG